MLNNETLRNAVIGSSNSEKLNGTNGDDVLIGGKGDDILVGGRGNDTYIFSKGDGIDQVINYANDGSQTMDMVVFTDIDSSEVTFHRQGNDLIVVYSDDGSDRVHLTDFFRGDNYAVNFFQFQDRVYSENEIKGLLQDSTNTILGTGNNDYILGTNDSDIIIGGKGDDILIGGRGSDLYVFSKGDGIDRVNNYAPDGLTTFDRVMFTDVDSSEVTFHRQGLDLIIVYSDDYSDRVHFTDFFRGAIYEVNFIQFGDRAYTNNDIKNLLQDAPNYLFGSEGRDNLTGTRGDDVLIGGKGNDTLNGGLGNDIYLFSKGDGIDRVNNYATDGAMSTDIIRFTDVNSSEASFYREGNDLVIVYSEDLSDRVHITGFFNGHNYAVDLIEFKDRTYVDSEIRWLIKDDPYRYFGTENNDRIIGSNEDDILIGGKGNDILSGGWGNDTYLFSKGDGIDQVNNYASDGAKTLDKVVFTDVDSSEASFYRQGNDLVIVYSDDLSDRVHLNNFFLGEYYAVDFIVFADKTYGADELNNLYKNASNTLFGTAGDDRINGTNDADILIGGKGNDILAGGRGSDLYIFSKGDGIDRIDNYAVDGARTFDRVLFQDISSTEASFYRQGQDLIIVYSEDLSDRVHITGFFYGVNYEVNFIQFNDLAYTSNDINTLLKDAPSYFFGSVDNDNLIGTNRDDILIGGKGNDTLSGGWGNDTYLFSKGDGIDRVNNYATDGAMSTDTIKFTDVNSSEANFYREGNDLVIVYSKDLSDRVHVTGFFSGHNYAVDLVEFKDRTYVDSEIRWLIKDNPYRYFGSDSNDRIVGSSGDDVLIGGKGDDILTGGLGNDTYIFSKGDGIDQVNNYATDGAKTIDKIVFTDVMLNEATFYRQGNNLVIVYSDDLSDRVQINNYYAGANYEVDIIEFKDKTFYSADELKWLLSQNKSATRAGSPEVGITAASTIDQEVHSLVNAMAAFNPSYNEDSIAADDISLTQPLITTSSF